MVQFITQVATSIEQSQQLIELGVKPETADLVYRCTKLKTDSLEWELQLCPPSLENIDNNDIPAWSLVSGYLNCFLMRFLATNQMFFTIQN
ncbi:hypothetical protein NXX19_20325 [Bacteroides ovatus]|nr:hypothetical protein [Bacteroides ovatus]